VVLDPVAAAIAPVPRVSQGTTHERSFNYTYAELNYRGVHVEDNETHTDGPQLRGAYAFDGVDNEILRRTFVFGSWSNLGDDFDFDEFEIGAGYVHPVSDKLDLVGTFSLLRQEIDAGSADDDEIGFEITGGGRMWIAEQLELNGRLAYRDVLDDDFGIVIGGRYHANDRLSFGADTEFGGDLAEIRLGARWQF
jgi:hypothetical protein